MYNQGGYTLLPAMMAMVMILFIISQGIILVMSRQQTAYMIRNTNNTRGMASMVPKERTQFIAGEIASNQGMILSRLMIYCEKEKRSETGKLETPSEVMSLLSRAIAYELMVEQYTVQGIGGNPAFDIGRLPVQAYLYQSEVVGREQDSRLDSWITFKNTAQTSGSQAKDIELRRLTDYNKVKNALRKIVAEVEKVVNGEISSISGMTDQLKILKEELDYKDQWMLYTINTTKIKDEGFNGGVQVTNYDRYTTYTPMKLVGNHHVKITVQDGVVEADTYLVEAVMSYQKEERNP